MSTLWLGFIGFIDDYIKVFKKDKAGLRAKSKLVGQIGLGLIVGGILYFNQYVVVREKSEHDRFVYEQKTNLIDDLK
jgi:phospho-N-acetylmuramoyl-pentapeptide-transferase